MGSSHNAPGQPKRRLVGPEEVHHCRTAVPCRIECLGALPALSLGLAVPSLSTVSGMWQMYNAHEHRGEGQGWEEGRRSSRKKGVVMESFLCLASPDLVVLGYGYCVRLEEEREDCRTTLAWLCPRQSWVQARCEAHRIGKRWPSAE